MTLALEYMGATTGFILGRSRIGLDHLDASATVSWLPALCDALSVSVSRGGQRDGLVDSLDVGTLTARFLDAMDPTTDDNVRPNTPIRLRRAGAPIFTGVVQDVAMTDDRDGRRYVTLTAVDGRAALTNTQRYGAISAGGVGFESWAQRINRLRTSAQTSTAEPDPDPERLVYSVLQNDNPWTTFGTVPFGLTVETPQRTTQGLQAIELNTAPVSWGAQARGYEVTVTGLVVGATYRLTGTLRDALSSPGIENTPDSQRPYHWQAGVTGKGYGAEVVLPTTDSTRTLPSYTFVASSTSHVVRVTNARAVNRTSGTGTMVNLVIDVQVRQVTTDPFLLRDVVFESTLANHFDLACNSVGARWWVDRTNVVRFSRAADRPDVIARFSDEHASHDPLHVCYQDVTLGYDTRNAINNLSLTNHGRRFDTETATWAADDQTSVHEDMTAIASWGARSASVDTSLYTGSGHEADVVIRAYQLLADAVVPSVRPTSVRFNVDDGEHVLAGLDYYSRVTVTRAGSSWTCRVVGIEHEITPLDGHHITLTLREDI